MILIFLVRSKLETRTLALAPKNRADKTKQKKSNVARTIPVRRPGRQSLRRLPYLVSIRVYYVGHPPPKAECTLTLRSDIISVMGLGLTSTIRKGRPSSRRECVTLAEESGERTAVQTNEVYTSARTGKNHLTTANKYPIL